MSYQIILPFSREVFERAKANRGSGDRDEQIESKAVFEVARFALTLKSKIAKKYSDKDIPVKPLDEVLPIGPGDTTYIVGHFLFDKGKYQVGLDGLDDHDTSLSEIVDKIAPKIVAPEGVDEYLLDGYEDTVLYDCDDFNTKFPPTKIKLAMCNTATVIFSESDGSIHVPSEDSTVSLTDSDDPLELSVESLPSFAGLAGAGAGVAADEEKTSDRIIKAQPLAVTLFSKMLTDKGLGHVLCSGYDGQIIYNLSDASMCPFRNNVQKGLLLSDGSYQLVKGKDSKVVVQNGSTVFIGVSNLRTTSTLETFESHVAVVASPRA